MSLPVNVDTTYPDDALIPSRKLHQQHHDLIHDAINALTAAYDAAVAAGFAGTLAEWAADLADVATQQELDDLSAAAAKVATGPAATYGTDLVTNGSFTGSATGWTLGGGAVYGTNNVTLISGSTVEQSVSVVAGTLYQIEWTDTAGGTISVALGTASDVTAGSAVALVAPSTGTVTLRLTFTGAGSVDDITARPVIPSAPATTVGGVEVRRPNSTSLGIGTSAQFSLTTGNYNVATGFYAQQSLTTGNYNVATGYQAQRSLTTGNYNVATGSYAQYSLTTGSYNVATGYQAQFSLTTGSNNVATGFYAQRSLTTGSNNVATGYQAQYSLTTGSNNVATGFYAQQSLTTGNYNVATGYQAQRSLTTGNYNVATGFYAQFSLTTGSNNVATGYQAQYSLTTGSNNVATGFYAQQSPAGVVANATTTGLRQTMIGTETGQSSPTQINDAVGVGYRAVCGADKAMSLGANARADHAGSVALGSDTLTTLSGQVMVGPRDVEITDATKGIVLKSPAGSRYRVTVSNTGTLTAAAA